MIVFLSVAENMLVGRVDKRYQTKSINSSESFTQYTTRKTKPITGHNSLPPSLVSVNVNFFFGKELPSSATLKLV
jgi:hypothetical protein